MVERLLRTSGLYRALHGYGNDEGGEWVVSEVWSIAIGYNGILQLDLEEEAGDKLVLLLEIIGSLESSAPWGIGCFRSFTLLRIPLLTLLLSFPFPSVEQE